MLKFIMSDEIYWFGDLFINVLIMKSNEINLFKF